MIHAEIQISWFHTSYYHDVLPIIVIVHTLTLATGAVLACIHVDGSAVSLHVCHFWTDKEKLPQRLRQHLSQKGNDPAYVQCSHCWDPVKDFFVLHSPHELRLVGANYLQANLI